MSLEKVGVLVTGNQNTGQTQKTKILFAARETSLQNAFCPMVA
jgi:hypothetical protein